MEIEIFSSEDFQQKLARCIHCGLCLPSCPTYAVFGSEMDSPRGRIALMRAAAGGQITPQDFQTVFARHIQRCLACRACETACPSGVQYGALVEAARSAVERIRRPGLQERFLRWAGTQQLMARPERLKRLARLLWLYEVSGLQRLVRALDDYLPQSLKAMEALLPPLTLRFTDYRRPAHPIGARRGRVLFFSGCIQEGFLSGINQATLRVLQVNGYEVATPAGQTCCGAAHLHLGDREGAQELARRNIDAFLKADPDGFDAILSNAGGCGAALKEYPALLGEDTDYVAQAQEFSDRVQDISEFLCDHLHFPPEGAVQETAVYVDSCHLRHGQKIVRQPRDLLRQVPGLRLAELNAPERCCGSAGVYNIAQAVTAEAILEAKMADIASLHPDLIVVSNTGCHLQLLAGARKAGMKVRVVHVVEVLDESYQLALTS